MKSRESNPEKCLLIGRLDKLKKIIIFLAVCIISGAGFSQTINSSATWNGIAGTPFVITVTATGGILPYTWTTAYPSGFPPANDPTPWLTVVPSTTGTLTINANPPAATDDIFFLDVTVDDDTPPSVTQQLVINITRPAYDLVFVLDQSGSMGSLACPTCVESRLDVLKESMSILINYASDESIANDRVGFVYFSTDTSKYGASALYNLLTFDVGSFETDLSARMPLNMTAMGKGLHWGFDRLTITTKPRHIILMSDGLQNINPKVVYGSPITLSGTDISTLGIKIHTIAIGHVSLAAQLKQISDATGGLSQASLDPLTEVPGDMTDLFGANFIDVLRGSSPAYVNILPDQTIGTVDTQTFVINNNVKKLFFTLNWSGKNSFNFKVSKDGFNVSQYGRYHDATGHTYRMFSINLPVVNTAGDTLAVSGGEWELDIKSRSDGNYKTTVLADDHGLLFDCSFMSTKYIIDDTLKFNVDIKLDGKPVADSVTVRAVIVKPGDDIGTLLAMAGNPDISNPSIEENALPGEVKFENLMKDQTFYDKLREKLGETILKNNGDGSYSGNYDSLTVTGAYKVLFFIEGEKSQTGKIQRMDIRTTVVEFGNADLASSDVHTVFNAVDNKLYLSIKPKTSSGLMMGPLSGHFSIKLESSIGTIGEPIDNLDGSYLFPVEGATATDAPVFTIHIGDQLLHEGQVTETGPVVDLPGLNLPWWLWLLLVLIVVIIIIIIWVRKKN